MRIFLTLLVLMFYSNLAHAQGHGIYCNQSESTAQTQACLKKHLDSAQKRLNKTYAQLEKSLDEGKRAELKELQQTWLRYRDAECMWESTQTDTASLERINEISCMARLTDDRADILTVVYDDTSMVGGRKEFGSFPRWMNVVAKDHPQISWQYGSRESLDLNCDSEDEKIITGFSTKEFELEAEDENRAFLKNVAIAVVQNPMTGRPQSKLFTFKVGNEDSADQICSDEISISLEESEPAKNSENSDVEEDEKGCYSFLQLNAKGCDPKKILWTGKSYEIVIEEATEENNENK